MNAIETLRKFVELRAARYERFHELTIDWPALLAEVSRLQAIADKLPKTADGVTVTPGMRVYWPNSWNGISQGEAGDIRDENTAELSSCYSTREAAEQAARKDGDK